MSLVSSTPSAWGAALAELAGRLDAASGVAAAAMDDFQTGSGIADGTSVGNLIADVLVYMALVYGAWVIASRLAAGIPESGLDWARVGWTTIRALLMPAVLALFIAYYF